jgi:hypothetical protein
MGNNLFGVDIAGIVNTVIAPQVLSATLIKVTAEADPVNPTGAPTETTTSYACRGFLDSYDQSRIDGTLVEVGDRMALIFGNSIASGVVPESGDQLTIENTTWEVISVMRDPDAATYELQLRGV